MMKFGKPGEQPQKPSGLMTFKDLKEYLRLGRTSLYTMVRNREIPCYVIGGEYRFKAEEIDAWLEARKMEPVGLI